MLADNRNYFHKRVRIAHLLYNSGNYEDCINYIAETAKFCWYNFTGYYKSTELENILHNIGEKILPKFNSSETVQAGPELKILHIASELYTTGGHTKLLFNWIKNDPENLHSVFVTRMTTEQCQTLAENYRTNTENLIGGVRNTKTETAILLQNELKKNYDCIILHIHPDETITNIVLANPGIKTPVLFLNHADHTFSLGINISDYLIQIRESNIPLDVPRRDFPTERQFFLPIPIETSSGDKKHISNTQLRLLSTGTAFKYTPNDKYDFLKEIDLILSKHPDISVDIVGIPADSEYAKEHPDRRIKYHGILSAEQLNELENKADIYLEGFPMASFTALLQTAMKKKPFLLHYDALPIFKLFSDSEENAILYPKNKEEWRAEADRLISDENYRLQITERQFSFLNKNYSLEAWKRLLKNIYISASSKRESDKKIDTFFEGENERVLETLANIKIRHYASTDSLKFLDKLKVVLAAVDKNENVMYGTSSSKYAVLFRYLFR